MKKVIENIKYRIRLEIKIMDYCALSYDVIRVGLGITPTSR